MREHVQGRNGRARIAFLAVAAVVMSLVGVGLAGSAAAATTLIVDDDSACAGAMYTSIADAVAAASDGDTIQVCAGHYDNFSDLGMTLTFLGPQKDVHAANYPTAAGEAVIDADFSASPVINFTGGSTLNGFKVIAAARGIVANSDSTIRSNSIDEVDEGIDAGNNILISQNLIRATEVGVQFFTGSGFNAEVSDNIFEGALTNGAVVVPGTTPDDDPVTNLAILRNKLTVESGGGGLVQASHTTGLKVEGNVVDAGGEQVTLINLQGNDHDWSVKANLISNTTANAMQVTCVINQDDTGSGSITQNTFPNVAQAVLWQPAGSNCSGTFEVHFNAFITGDPTASNNGDNGALDNRAQATVNAQNNFFGCQTGPGTNGCSSAYGVTSADPYLVLHSSIGTKTLSTGQTTPFTVDLNHNSNGQLFSTPVADGLPISFSASTYLSITPAASTLVGGKATASVKAKSTPGNKGVTGQSVSGTVSFAKTTQSPITVRPTPPVLSINGTTTAEGRSGTHVVYFPVTLSHKFDKVVTVKYATANGTAKAPADFVAKSGTLSIPVGATTAKVGITIKGDKIVEPNESYFVTFFSPVNATVSDPNAIGVIRNS